jgi:hypothetical protein
VCCVSEYTGFLTEFLCEFAFLVGRCSLIEYTDLLSTELINNRKLYYSYIDSKRKFINYRDFSKFTPWRRVLSEKLISLLVSRNFLPLWNPKCSLTFHESLSLNCILSRLNDIHSPTLRAYQTSQKGRE